MTWSLHVTVAAVIARHDHFLLVEEQIDDGTRFNQPAGHLEPGETLIQAIRREVFEETARLFEPDALIGVYQYEMADKQRTYLRFCFSGSAGAADTERALDSEIVATHWFTLGEIQARHSSLRSPMVLQCIEDYRRGTRLPLGMLHYLTP